MANGNVQSSNVTWQATGATPRVQVVGGQPVSGHLVTFTTGNGNSGEVFVPESVTSVDAARQLVADRAAYLDGLASLSG